MTKKKAPAKKRTSAKGRNSTASAAALPPAGEIPEGMKQLGGGYAPTWKPDERRELHFTVTGAVREVEMTIGRKKQTRRCLEATTLDDEARYTIWESAALGDFFDQVATDGEGGEYYIRYDGLGTAKKGQNPPKLFTVAAAA